MRWDEYVYLSPSSPTWLRWKFDILDTRGHRTKAVKDGVAGGGSGRYKIQVKDVQHQCSRVVYEIVYGEIPEGFVVDHKDGNEINNDPENLALKTLEQNNQNVKKSIRNKTGKVGVYFHLNHNGVEYAEAFWHDKGKKITKRFSCNKYGRYKAFELASNARDIAIATLNDNGAVYTERHGT